MKSQKQMGHFIGWKFGVPVRILNIRGVQVQHFMYLIDETENYFRVMSIAGGFKVLSKTNCSYELIPHKYNYPGGANEPRYPICESPGYTAFCNSLNEIVHLEALSTAVYKFVSMSAATITIDGKTIELSAETTAELKKKLGV